MTQPEIAPHPGPVLAAAVRGLARGASLDTALAALLHDAAVDAGADIAALFVRTADGDALQLAAAHGLSPDARTGLEAEVAGDPGHAIATAADDARPVVGRLEARPGGTTTWADLPLVVSHDGIDAVIGILSVGWTGERAIDDGMRAALDAAADLAALALDRERLASLAHERADWMARMATADPLTGLANRRTLDRVLELEIARAGRQGSDVSVAVLDVDGFRAMNERAGAAAGDAVLRAVAAVVAEQVRLVDTVARIGGDEFALVAPGSGGVIVADRVLRAVEALGPVHGIAVTVSAGIARFPADGTSADELLGAALTALDGARSTGHGAIAEVGAG